MSRKRRRKPVPPEECCTEEVWIQLGIGGEWVQCSNRGKYIKDGRLVCGTHSEEAERRREEKRAARQQLEDARWQARVRASRRGALFLELLAVLERGLATRIMAGDFRADWVVEGRALVDKVRAKNLGPTEEEAG